MTSWASFSVTPGLCSMRFLSTLPASIDRHRQKCKDTQNNLAGEEMTTTWKCLAAMLVLALAPVSARADDYPSHPIRLIVPYAPAGGADAVARIVAKRVSETIGQPIAVENRGGAGSIIGTEMVKKADPDGYTLLLGQSGPISINPAIYRKLPYDPVKDFAPVTLTTSFPYIMVVSPKLGVKTV